MTIPLGQIYDEIDRRCKATVAAQEDWPCRQGCDFCCRNLAAPPQLTAEEWDQLKPAIASLPQPRREEVTTRIRETAASIRPVICPLLDRENGSCLVYAARPVACRTYGFYVERGSVLGCSQIEARAAQTADIVWGNHEAVLARLGPHRPLAEWLEADAAAQNC